MYKLITISFLNHDCAVLHIMVIWFKISPYPFSHTESRTFSIEYINIALIAYTLCFLGIFVIIRP